MVVPFGGGARMGGGGREQNQNSLSFWRGTSQHADCDVNQEEVLTTAKKPEH